MTGGGGGEVVAVQVPATEDEILVIGHSCDGHARERQTIQTVRTRFDGFDAGDSCRRDRTAHANERHSDASTGLNAHGNSIFLLWWR